MEMYILDSLYRRVQVVDNYESLIWAERATSIGDFEMHIVSTLTNRSRFIPGINLATNVSTRIMTVETVEDVTDDEGRRILKITGPSFENVLRQRTVAWNDAGDWVKWTGEDVPLALLNALFNDICVTGVLHGGDVITPLILSSIYPADTIGEPTDEIVFTPDIGELYDAIKDLSDAFSIGFRFTRDPYLNLLHFDFYMGSDRTTTQTTLPAVVFSPDFDNLRNTNRLTSTSLYKNAAYVMNATLHEIVYALDVDPSVEGFERRVLTVVGDDDMDSAALIRKGKDELAKNRMLTALDGQLIDNSQYIYGVHYHLNDLVELRDDDGTTSHMQVTEQIFVSDKEGERAYPTLSINTFITPGSWLAWDFAEEWDDLDTEEWDDLP
jgi:hypothetical protein